MRGKLSKSYRVCAENMSYLYLVYVENIFVQTKYTIFYSFYFGQTRQFLVQLKRLLWEKYFSPLALSTLRWPCGWNIFRGELGYWMICEVGPHLHAIWYEHKIHWQAGYHPWWYNEVVAMVVWNLEQKTHNI